MPNLRHRTKHVASDKDEHDRDRTEPFDEPSSQTEGEDSSDNEDSDDDGKRRISVLDVFRLIFVLVLTSSVLSYYVTSDSLIWGYKRPQWTKLPVLMSYINGRVHLTPTELSLYDGTSPSLPVYVSINGTIYDVSASRHTYGPGGSYSFFAGRDATRAFVTGCFLDDLTDDLRGVETMFIPIEDDEDGEEEMAMSEVEKRERGEQELEAAREKVTKAVGKWMAFYRNHEKYFEVGRLVKDGEVEEGDVRSLCGGAVKARPKRSRLRQKEREKQEKEKKKT